MTQGDDASPPNADRERRVDGDVVIWPMGWTYVTAAALLLMGLIIVIVSPDSKAAWSWQHTGLLLFAVGGCAILAIPGALRALGHSWADPLRPSMERRLQHPRLVGLAQAWAGIFMLGGASVLIFFQLPDPLRPISLIAVALIAIGPLFAVVVFDDRR